MDATITFPATYVFNSRELNELAAMGIISKYDHGKPVTLDDGRIVCEYHNTSEDARIVY